MTGSAKAAARGVVFNHLAGIVLAPTFHALRHRGLFDLLNGNGKFWTADEINDRINGNRGYLQVALRLLASAGWLQQRFGSNGTPPSYASTREGTIAAEIVPALYEEIRPHVPSLLHLQEHVSGSDDGSVLESLEALVCRVKRRWGLAPQRDAERPKVYSQICNQLDGIVVGPAMVALARAGILAQIEQGPVEQSSIGADAEILGCLFDVLATQGWIMRNENGVALTACGAYASNIATSYGVTVSYLPLFCLLEKLLFGDASMPRLDASGTELLVDRGMNVWGSGGAHRNYFEKVDEIIMEIFDRPLDLQPKGICDMGCGDGTFLEHLYSVVRNRTLRGAVLDKQPLVMVGADVNKVARQIAEHRMREANIPTFHVIAGDIENPEKLAGDLEGLGIDVRDLLHVRSFLDHNRPYVRPEDYMPGKRTKRTTGAFAHLGKDIPPDELEENLVRHLRKWVPYVCRFGLVVLELHTLPPQVTAENLDRTPAIAYDGTHGFSDQFLVELPIFLDCAREAGLEPDARHQAKFPPSELASVSINFFRAMSGGEA